MRAETLHPCVVLLEIERFPIDLAGVRSGSQDPAQVLVQVDQVQRALRTKTFADVSSTPDLNQVQLYANTVSKRLFNMRDLPAGRIDPHSAGHFLTIHAQLNRLIDHYGCRNGAVSSAGTDSASVRTSEPGAGFSRGTNLHSPAEPGVAGYSYSSGMMLLSAIALATIAGLLLFLWLSEVSRRAGRQRGCHTRALLTFGKNCTVTNVSTVSRHGAKLQAPIVEIPTKSVELYVAGHRIAARQDWANKYFLGIVFTHSVSPQVVADIVAASQEEDQLAKIGENATECFAPGCHLDCEKHRATQISVKQAEEVA